MSTNFVRAKYQEIYDVNTVSNKVSIIGIHTPVGSKPRQMLAGHFLQYRKYRYDGCSVIASPSARLGLNLAQLSTESGASTVNPKDVWNPILVRGCHGDNLNSALNSIYKGSFQNEGSSIGKDDFTDSVVPVGSLSWEQMYYRMLQDPSFKKFSMSSGIKLTGLHPLVYNLASNHQIVPNETAGDFVGALKLSEHSSKASVEEVVFEPALGATVPKGDGSGNQYILPHIMTNRLQKLGWLDTRQVINSFNTGVPAYTTLPKIFMACIVLPMAKSDSVVTSMRFVVTHYWSFKEFNTSLTLEGASEYYDWLTTQSKNNDTFQVQTGEEVSDSVELVSDGVF